MEEMEKHLPNVKEEKLKILLETKLAYNEGRLDLETAKSILKEKVGTLKPYEIALTEQKLKTFDELECRKENIQEMLILFEDIMDRSRPELNSNHPIMIYYRENDELREELKEIEKLRPYPIIKNEWYEIYDRLDNWWKFHLTRKQNQLYPILEKKGFNRPTTTMWVLDDFIRDEIKEARKLLENDKEEEFLNQQKIIIEDIKDLMSKEETILYPTSLAMINEEEFEYMKFGDLEIGFALKEKIIHKKEIKEENKNDFTNDLQNLLSKYGYSVKNDNQEFDVATGKMTLEQINLVYKHMPVDITYVDENDIVKFYTDTEHRVFPRSKNVIGRDVKNCHPRKSVHLVEEIIEKFRNGEQNKAEFWINKPDIFIYIIYIAVRDENGKFRGVIEMMQDCTRIRSLTDSRTLLTWDSEEKSKVENKIEEKNESIEITKDTYLKDLLKIYPKLKDDMTKISPKFALLKTPLARVMLPTATIEKMSERSGMKVEDIIKGLEKLIDTYNKK